MGYAGSCAVAVLDDVAGMNERVDSIEGSAANCQIRMDEVHQELTEWTTEFTDERARSRVLEEQLRVARIEVGQLRLLTTALVRDLGTMRDDFTRFVMRSRGEGVRGPLVDRAAENPQRLVPYQGRLVPIEVGGRAEMAYDLTDDSGDDVVPNSEPSGSSGSLGSIRDFAAEEARERGEVVEHAVLLSAQRDPAPEYERAPSYED